MCQENLKAILFLILYAIQTGLCDEACKPMVEENHSVTLNCSVSGVKQRITWTVNGQVIVECFTNNNTCVYNTSKYAVGLTNISAANINQLAIHNVHRTEKYFTCLVDSVKVQECTICVTTKPRKPTCETPTFTGNDNDTLLVTCETSSVYPDAMCSLAHFNNSKQLVGTARTEKSSTDDELSDVSVKCIVEIKLQNAPPTEEQFSASFSPACDLTQGVIHTALSTPSDFTAPISLKLPVVSKLKCESGYIPIGSPATCKCELSTLGNPPGSARWYSEAGLEVGLLNDRYSLLNVTLNAANLKPGYYCKPYSILNTSQENSHQLFQPEFSYGPYEVLAESSEFDLCVSNEVNIMCNVPLAKVQPKPLYTIIFNREEIVSKLPSQENENYYFYNYIFSPNTTGVIQYRCRAHSSMSSEYYIEKFGNLTLRGPPTSYPVITVSNSVLVDGKVQVTKNTNIEISCAVEGGYPKVSSVTLECPSQTVTAAGQYAQLTTKVNDSLQRMSCRCVATHESTCYRHQSSKITFIVNGSEESLPLLAIGLGVSGGFIFILIIIIGIIVCVKLRKSKEQQHTIQNEKDDYNSIRPNDHLDNGSIYCEIYDNNDYMKPDVKFNEFDQTTTSGNDNYSFNTSPTYQSSDWTEYNRPPLCRTNINQQQNDYLHVL